VVTYDIKVLSTGDNSFHILDRYRNMRSLWENIREDSRNPDRIPEFPPKKWFGNKSRDFLEQRKCALEVFFNTLLDNPDKIIYDHIMKYFKKLAKNREAKDALQSIEESISKPTAAPERKREEESKDRNAGASQPESPQKQQPAKPENKAGQKTSPAKDNKAGVLNAKDSAER